MGDMDKSTQSPVRVVVVDDHVPYRRGICAALDGHGFEVCAEAFSGPTAVQAALEHRPDVVLMDISMPGGDGITATAQITSQMPETKVVMLTAVYDDANLFGAIKAGASGYLLKGSTDEDLPHRLREVLEGEATFSPGLVMRLIDEFRGRERPKLFRPKRRENELTEREWEILQMLKEDMSTTGIAKRLSVSSSAVRTHISVILKKLRVTDRKAAVQAVADEPRSQGRR